MDTKAWYESKTIWGAVVAVVLPILGALNSKFAVLGADQDSLVTLLTSLGSAVGGLVAVIGRVTATATIAPKPPA